MGKFFNTILNSILLVFIGILILTVGAQYEGRVFPVVRDFEITKYEKHGDKTWVWVEFEKVRNCEYLGVAWYYEFSQFGLITFERRNLNLFPDGAPQNQDPNRPEGVQVAGPWEVDLTIDDIQKHSFLTTTHRCHPFYITRTYLYDTR